jgi:hypothetical protein
MIKKPLRMAARSLMAFLFPGPFFSKGSRNNKQESSKKTPPICLVRKTRQVKHPNKNSHLCLLPFNALLKSQNPVESVKMKVASVSGANPKKE